MRIGSKRTSLEDPLMKDKRRKEDTFHEGGIKGTRLYFTLRQSTEIMSTSPTTVRPDARCEFQIGAVIPE